MLNEDLCQEELLQLNPGKGLIHFSRQGVLGVDAKGMGALMDYLVKEFGWVTARNVLTQFGFAHGWCLAESTTAEFIGGSNTDWRDKGKHSTTVDGLFCVGSTKHGLPHSQRATGSEASEQHPEKARGATACTCWMMAGLQSGYLSAMVGKEIFVVEDRCVSKGDADCHFVARTREEWGEKGSADLRFFEPSRCDSRITEILHSVTAVLGSVAGKLRNLHDSRLRGGEEVLLEESGIVARSNVMTELVELARRVAKVDSTVLITGESGSGKERIARLVHEESACASGPFIAVNCGAITETLLESELFGHVRGAFTGATHDRPGLFEAAEGGTLLLDEIGEVSPSMQTKLLRVLQEREVRRVGENKSRKINVRVVAATNRDLALGISEGAFRPDLYYRLKVVELQVPPLRERREDILPLARLLLAKAAARMKRDIAGLSPNAAEQLLRYEWPGNVRELENAMERAVALTRSERVEVDDLPQEARNVSPKISVLAGPVRPLEEIEKEHILAALVFNRGNQTHTAEQLRIGSATLYRKLKSYGVLNERRAARNDLTIS